MLEVATAVAEANGSSLVRVPIVPCFDCGEAAVDECFDGSFDSFLCTDCHGRHVVREPRA